MSLDVIIRRNIICWLHIDYWGYRIRQDFAFIVHSITVNEEGVFRRQFRLILTLCIFVGLLESLDYCIIISLFLNHVSSFDISPLLL